MNADPESAAWWGEIKQHAARQVPRLDPRYGLCPICRLPWTVPFDFCGVWYGRCTPCNTFGLIGERAFHAYTAPDDEPDDEGLSPAAIQRLRDEILFADLVDLSRALRVEPLFPAGAEMKPATTRSTTAAEQIPLFDPWSGVTGSSGDWSDGRLPPPTWRLLSEGTRQRVGGALIAPDPDRLGPLRILRAHFQTASDMGETESMQAKLAPYFVADLAERALWKRAVDELSSPEVSPFLLRDASLKLQRAGNLADILRARRRELDAQIETLERVQGQGVAS
jgi:hypothetical protein